MLDRDSHYFTHLILNDMYAWIDLRPVKAALRALRLRRQLDNAEEGRVIDVGDVGAV